MHSPESAKLRQIFKEMSVLSAVSNPFTQRGQLGLAVIAWPAAGI